MGSTMFLTKNQMEYVEKEGHHEGKRYVLVFIDRKTGGVEMDYRDEVLRTLKYYEKLEKQRWFK